MSSKAVNKYIKPNLDGFFRGSFWGVTPCLKLLRIMLETSNFARKYSFRKYTFQYQGPLNFADVSIFYKKMAYITQSNVRAVLEIF